MPRDRNGVAAKWEAAGQDENEKFRTFFSNTVAQIPKDMAEPAPEKKVGFLARLFGGRKRKGEKRPEPDPAGYETESIGELVLDASAGEDPGAGSVQEASDPGEETAPREEKRYAAPEGEKRGRGSARHATRRPPLRLFGGGEDETASSAGIADPDDTMSLELVEPETEPETPIRLEEEAAEPAPVIRLEEEKTAPQAAPAAEPARSRPVEEAAQTEPPQEAAAKEFEPERISAEEPAAAERAGETPDTPPEKNAPAGGEQAAETPPEESARHTRRRAAEDEDEAQTPEEIGEGLRRLCAGLNLRCALSGVLAAALLGVGLIGEGLLSPLPSLDPVTAPVAFMGANLLLLLAAMAVSYSVLRDGLWGLLDEPSLDTLPALATMGALVQALAAVLNAESYQAAGLRLMSGVAALLLFLAALGERLMAGSVRESFELMDSGVEHQGACRVTDRELIRCLAEGQGEEDPWVLYSRPIQWTSRFIQRSFSPRASEKSARRMGRLLLAGGLLGAVLMLVTGRGFNGAAAALAAILCLGAPLSATLIAGLASLRMERTAGAVGAVIPGWDAVEELGGMDTIHLNASELFTPESAQLKDIRIFKGGRIDKAILYAASTFNQGCDTLSGLFREIIENRTDILLPVKDLERRPGLGFAGWCDNNPILIGTRALMEQEGVTLPEKDYEDRHTMGGEYQLLYLAVSGSLYAMFVLHYVGGKNAARCLNTLQRENIRLMVSCQDPSLTADKIEAAYHLPEGMITVLSGEQDAALAPWLTYAADADCCMIHLKGLVSLVGGLRAAERAQTGELFGTTIQKASVWFSVVIGLLLAYAGSIGTLSLTVVLMYQAAWSALGIAAAAMKQNA